MLKQFLFPLFILSIFSCSQKNEEQKETPENDTIKTLFESSYTIQKDSAQTTIKQGKISLTVKPEKGGRIASFSYNGKNILTEPDVNPDNWGSTFWTSPQEQWGWPPPKAFDKMPHRTVVDEANIITISPIDTTTDFRLIKKIGWHHDKECIEIEYRVVNEKDTDQSVAAWEISRLEANGLTFFKAQPSDYQAPYTTVDSLGYAWFDYPNSKIQEDHSKLIGNTEGGWVAYVKDGLLFLKVFEDIAEKEAAPKEGELEIYANPDKSYIEVEPQSAYKNLAPSDTLKWKVLWHLDKIPENAEPKVGNNALLDFVKSTVKNLKK